MVSIPTTLDIHIGAWSPSRWDEIDEIRSGEEPTAWGDRRRPPITKEGIDWPGIGITPRWVGDDSSEAVAAVEPSLFLDRGAQEWRRFVAGAAARGELALAVSMIGSDEKPSYGPLLGPRASVMLPGAQSCSVDGAQIALASPPQPAADLDGADKDLALRLTSMRPPELPWWRLGLQGLPLHRSAFDVEVTPRKASFHPC